MGFAEIFMAKIVEERPKDVSMYFSGARTVLDIPSIFLGLGT